MSAVLTATAIEMTEDEYVCTLSNSKRFEFTDGVVTAKRGPYMTQLRHMLAATEFTLMLVAYARQTGGLAGQTPTSNLSHDQRRLYRIPDLAYWGPGVPFGNGIFTPPTLAIELVSPDQSVRDLREKCVLYRSTGVDVAWLAHPEQCWVEVWEDLRNGARVERTGVLESPRLPGLRIDLAQMFATIDAEASKLDG